MDLESNTIGTLLHHRFPCGTWIRSPRVIPFYMPDNSGIVVFSEAKVSFEEGSPIIYIETETIIQIQGLVNNAMIWSLLSLHKIQRIYLSFWMNMPKSFTLNSHHLKLAQVMSFAATTTVWYSPCFSVRAFKGGRPVVSSVRWFYDQRRWQPHLHDPFALPFMVTWSNVEIRFGSMSQFVGIHKQN